MSACLAVLIPSPTTAVSKRLISRLRECPLDPQRQEDPRPAGENQIDADERADDPEHGFGEVPPDVDAEQQRDEAAEHDPRPTVEVIDGGHDDANGAPDHEQ